MPALLRPFYLCQICLLGAPGQNWNLFRTPDVINYSCSLHVGQKVCEASTQNLLAQIQVPVARCSLSVSLYLPLPVWRIHELIILRSSVTVTKTCMSHRGISASTSGCCQNLNIPYRASKYFSLSLVSSIVEAPWNSSLAPYASNRPAAV
jgi:hypothetical protein